MEYGKLMLGWHKDWTKLFENILWRDEAVFHISGFVDRHNCQYWVAYDPEVTVDKMQNRPKVNV
jgi:Ser/Thr protein kinase RdoA (MazF antagonist)